MGKIRFEEKRFSIAYLHEVLAAGQMIQDRSGDYYPAADYEALEAKCEKLRKALKKISAPSNYLGKPRFHGDFPSPDILQGERGNVLLSMYEAAIDKIHLLETKLAAAQIDVKQLQSTIGVIEEENTELRKLNNSLRADEARLNKMRTHCEKCGGDYLATGVEAGCPCQLEAKIARLRKALEGLFQNKHIDLDDIVYTVREHEGQGWDGPSVKQWGEAVAKARAAVYEPA